jgi:hypothetical protein
MSNLISNILLERIQHGLNRKAIVKPSSWACNYRVMGQPYPGLWTFEHHPWLKEMHDCVDEFVYGMKAAQMGFTETGLNVTFANMDLHGYSTLYVLPNQNPDAADFSASRFDPAIELSPHLQNLFSHVKNVGHKRAGSANLFIRGSRSESGLKSNPCPLVIFDEVDEMTLENIPLAYERASGQNFSQFWHFSTPKITSQGIAKMFFELSDESKFVFKCPNCSRWTHIPCPGGLVVNEEEPEKSYLVTDCQHQLVNEAKGDFLSAKSGAHWEPTHKNRTGRGFWIPQLYSMAKACRPGAIARTFLKARTDPAEEQELWNSKFGLPHEPEGSRVTDLEIQNCISNHEKGVPPLASSKLITLGVDVGKWLHYEIDEWHIEKSGPDLHFNAVPIVIDEGKVQRFEDLDRLMRSYQVKACVIDANPERRKAMEFALRFNGFVYLCFYSVGLNSKKDVTNTETTISVDRTSWMDIALGRFATKRIRLPKSVSDEYRHMIKIPTRIYDKDRNGNPTAKYVGEGDHGVHCRVYNEVALLYAAAMRTNSDIRAFL